MNEFQLLNDKKELANSQDILRDVLSGDPNALLLLDDKNLDKNAIKLALDFIMNNNTISDKEKQSLLHILQRELSSQLWKIRPNTCTRKTVHLSALSARPGD